MSYNNHCANPDCRECPAPLSPIALDKAEEVAWENYRRAAEGFYLTGQCDDLGPAQNALRRALVARVAQEEREKYEGRIKALETANVGLMDALAAKVRVAEPRGHRNARGYGKCHKCGVEVGANEDACDDHS